ncbi:Type I restriction endonuclease [Aromatoleum bremense]|nr:Type I restriction endonuclease [Aromatoleum bremense]
MSFFYWTGEIVEGGFRIVQILNPDDWQATLLPFIWPKCAAID